MLDIQRGNSMNTVKNTEERETYFFHDTTSSDFANFYRYRVRSPLIEAYIEGGTINNTDIISFTIQNDCYNFTRYYLTSLIKFAFNIQRRMGMKKHTICQLTTEKIFIVENILKIL